MLLIVFYHSILFWQGKWSVVLVEPVLSAWALDWISQWLGALLNYGFVLTSGYLFYYVKYERGGYTQFGAFVKNKAKRLLIPFLFVGAIWVIPISCAYLKHGLGQTVLKYLLVQDAGQLWFLVMLFGVFMLFWWLSDFFHNHNLWGAIAVVVIYGFRLVGPSFLPSVFSIWNVAKFVVIFWLGFKLRQESFPVIRKVPLWAQVVGYTALWAVYKFVELPHSTLNKLFSLGMEFVVHAVGAVMIFMLLQKIAQTVRWKDNKVVSFFTKHSMVIYLFHQQVIYFFIRELNGLINPYLQAAITFLGTTVICSGVAALLMRFPATRFLVGEKS